MPDFRNQLTSLVAKNFAGDETPEERRARLQREAAAERVARLREGIGITTPSFVEGQTDQDAQQQGFFGRAGSAIGNFFTGSQQTPPAIRPVRPLRQLTAPGLQAATDENAKSAASAAIQSRLLLQNPVVQQAFDPTLRPVLVPDTGLNQEQLNQVFSDPQRNVLLPDPAATPQVNPAPLQGAIQRLAAITRQNAQGVQELANNRKRRAQVDNIAALAPEVFKALTSANIDTGFQQRTAANRETISQAEELDLKARQEAALSQGEADVKVAELGLKADTANQEAKFKTTLDQISIANRAVAEQAQNLNTLARQVVSSSLSGRSSSSTGASISGLSDKTIGDLQKSTAELNARLQTFGSGITAAGMLNNQILQSGFDRQAGFVKRLLTLNLGTPEEVEAALEQAPGVFEQIHGSVPLFNTIFANASGLYAEAGLPVPQPFVRANEMANKARQIIGGDEQDIIKLERLQGLTEEYGDLFAGSESGFNALNQTGQGITPPPYELQGVSGVGGSLINAIIPQESGGDPNAVNARTGAFGITQFNPQYVDSWIALAGMTGEVTKDQLKSDPNLQAQVSARAMERVLYDQLNDPSTGGDPVIAFRRMASMWYSGNPNLHMSTKGEGPNGDEPSIKKYVDNVMTNWLQQNGYGDSVGDFIVPDESVQALKQQGQSFRDVASVYESFLVDAGGSGFNLEDLNLGVPSQINPSPVPGQPEDFSDIPLNVSAQERANMQTQADDAISALEKELAGGSPTQQATPQPTTNRPGLGAGDPLPVPQGSDTPFSLDVQTSPDGQTRASVLIDPDSFPDQNQLEQVMGIIEREMKTKYGEGNYIVSLKDVNGVTEGLSPQLSELIKAIRGQ